MRVVLRNARIFDGVSPELRPGDVLVEDDRIVEVGDLARIGDAEQLDLAGRTLMPGLIDAHVHAYFPDVDWSAGDRLPMTTVAHWARKMLEACLRRGFTSVRDTGGADYGLAMALSRGWVVGPRLFYCGKALSQTGGHGDLRSQGHEDLCSCGGYSGHVSRVVDGVDEIRRAVREEIRRGAHFIKLMGSGGVSSPDDSLLASQYSDDEIRAAVDETTRHGTYVTTHIHPNDALRRAIELGVPCVEHGTMVTSETAALAAERGTAIVPTLAVFRALVARGKDYGFPAKSLAKLKVAEPHALESLEILRRANVKVGFGTDLIGGLDRHQATEFQIRGEVLSPGEVLSSATSVNAEIIGQGDSLGRVGPGYLADLIAVNGDPLRDLGIFDEHGTKVDLIMRGGEIVKRCL